MEGTKQAVFAIGDEEYGFDIMDVNTIEKVIPIEPAANFPKNFKGIIRLRGDVIPVYSLRRKFGMEDIEVSDDMRFIITTSNDVQVAYEVDRMKEIMDFEPGQIYEAPTIVKSRDTAYMKMVTNAEDRLIIVLNQNGILSDEELNKMKAALNAK